MSKESKHREVRKRGPAAIALVVALLFSAGAFAAQPPIQGISSALEESSLVVAAVFAGLDQMPCVPNSFVVRLDQWFISLHDYDARSKLHRYEVCGKPRASR